MDNRNKTMRLRKGNQTIDVNPNESVSFDLAPGETARLEQGDRVTEISQGENQEYIEQRKQTEKRFNDLVAYGFENGLLQRAGNEGFSNEEVLQSRYAQLYKEAEAKAEAARQQNMAEDASKGFFQKALEGAWDAAAVMTNIVLSLVNKILPKSLQLPMVSTFDTHHDFSEKHHFDQEEADRIIDEYMQQQQLKKEMDASLEPDTPARKQEAKASTPASKLSPKKRAQQEPIDLPQRKTDNSVENVEEEFAELDRQRNSRPNLNGITFAPSKEKTTAWCFKRAADMIRRGKDVSNNMWAGITRKDAQLLNSLSNDQIRQIAGMDENDIGRFLKAQNTPQRKPTSPKPEQSRDRKPKSELDTDYNPDYPSPMGMKPAF